MFILTIQLPGFFFLPSSGGTVLTVMPDFCFFVCPDSGLGNSCLFTSVLDLVWVCSGCVAGSCNWAVTEVILSSFYILFQRVKQ